ncbi:ABC transporter permease [Spiroplasma endosymbiont of Diplazon laetatorius]|uniref:ABC transporter permease n=1 Tax=Spiroplasma endosymbiont of Diplazon laetatorius TaxID=3066322 RepID=UPI0030CCECEB
MKKSIFLYLKQGIKGVLRFKIQFIVIVILSFLATFILSVSLSSTNRLSNDYDQTMSKMDKFDFINEKTVGLNSSDEVSTYIYSSMDVINNQFNYVHNSEDPSNEITNKAIEANHNLVLLEDNKDYPDTFISKTFRDSEVQLKFLNMISDFNFFYSIFRYEYNELTEQTNWDPYWDNLGDPEWTSWNYVQNGKWGANSNHGYDEAEDGFGTIGRFYIPTLEKLKQNYLNDLFNEQDTPAYVKNTLFWKLKEEGSIDKEQLEKTKLTDNDDRNIYSRYLYFSLEGILRQLIRQSIEYPAFWINQAIKSSESKDLDSVVSEFNKISVEENIGFKWVFKDDTENIKKYATTIFAWIFGIDINSDVNGYTIDEEIKNKFLINEENKAWKNSLDLSVSYSKGDFLKNKSEVFAKGMRGSLSQITANINEKGLVKNYGKTFGADFLRHYNGKSLERSLDYATKFSYLNNYDKEFNYSSIKTLHAFFLRYKILADAFGFDYDVRGEAYYTDNVEEVTYRIIDIDQNTDALKNLTLYSGNMPRTRNEILIGQQFATSNKYKIGENIKIGGGNFVISGFASEPLSYYPMVDTNNPLPNSKKSAIVYANNYVMSQIESRAYQKNITKIFYNFLTTKEGEEKIGIQKTKEYNSYLFSNVEDFYNHYNFINNGRNFKKSSVDDYKDFESSVFKLNWQIAPLIIGVFKILSYIFCLIIFAITIIATVVAVKKTVELNSGEIGILKAMGARNSEISLSYISYGIVVMLFTAPLAWITGSVIQEFITKVFFQFSSGKSSILYFDALSLVISISVFGLLLCFISFFTAYRVVKRPTIEIMNKKENVKRIEWLDKMKNYIIRNKKFSSRFSFELAVSGFSKTMLTSSTVFFAAFFVSFGLTIPGIVQNVVGSYYKNVNYSNSYENIDLIGNAPLAKTTIAPTKYIDKYEENLIDSKDIFGNGISQISKNISDFAANPDNSAIPQLLLTEKNGLISPEWTYETMLGYNSMNNSLLASISSILGNNIAQLLGKGISVSDIQKMLEWKIHFNDYSDFASRKKDIDDVSQLLTDGLPAILTSFIEGSSVSEGNWKEQIVDIIISQTPPYIKQYVTRTENRLNNFQFGWEISKYIPGVDNFYTKLDIENNDKRKFTITGLDQTQNAYKIDDYLRHTVFTNDYQANILKKILKGDNNISQEELDDVNNFYDKNTKTLNIPVIANQQTDFDLDSKWDILNNPSINKSRLVIRDGSVDIPNEAWMYNDEDWMKYNKNYKNNTSDYFMEMSNLSASKFTYAPIFDKNNNLMDNSYGFYNIDRKITKQGEELDLTIRPYYSFDNINLLIPSAYKGSFQELISKGNKNKENLWYQAEVSSTEVPEVTKKAWSKIDNSFADSSYFSIKPYSMYFDPRNNYEKEDQNLSGKAVENITAANETFFGRNLRDSNGPIAFGTKELNWINKNPNLDKIQFKKVGQIDVYGSSLIIGDQSIMNILNGYDISKYTPFNFIYEDKSVPSKSYSKDGVTIQTFDYIDPLKYLEEDGESFNKDLIFGETDFEKSIRPSQWYNGVLSNSSEPLFITTQASFSRIMKSGFEAVNTPMYGDSGLEISSTKLLGQQKAMINQMSAIVLSIATIAISLLVIIIILTITLINDLYVNQYRKFMVVMKSLGYSNRNIILYTFGVVTLLSTISYIVGVVLNFTVIYILFSIISKNYGSMPFGFTWWTPIIAIILVFGSFFASIAITTRKIRKESPSILMR